MIRLQVDLRIESGQSQLVFCDRFGNDLPPKAVPHSMLVPGVEQVVPESVSRGADEA